MSNQDYRVTDVSDCPENIPTLFLHGFLGRGSDWNGIATSLGREVIMPDLPGHGDSVCLPPGGYTMHETAGAILGMLDTTGTKTCNAVGYSMGGRLALYLALRYPDRFTSLVLESSSPGLKTEQERTARRESDETFARRLESADDEDFRTLLEEWYRQPLFASLSRHEGLVEHLICERTDNHPAELAKSLRGMGTGTQPSLWDELPNLEVPTLAVVGEYDEKFTNIAREMSDISTKIEVVAFAGAGHNVHVEEPGEFVRLLKRSIRED